MVLANQKVAKEAGVYLDGSRDAHVLALVEELVTDMRSEQQRSTAMWRQY